MVFKITDLRKQYGVFQPAETEADALAYEEERQKNHEEAVAKKVEELKALYNSNPTKYSKFKNFDEEDWKNYAETCLKANSATTAKYSFSSLPSVENDPELAKWAKFTYEEILQMESTGVLIPKEILDKPAKLTPEETKIMHTHSELSYELLKTTDLDEKTLKLIRNHHQNAKKTGYPWVGKDFNADLNLQIVSIADKYSALTEPRPYKKSITPKQALTIIYQDVKDEKLHPFVFKALVNYAKQNETKTLVS